MHRDVLRQPVSDLPLLDLIDRYAIRDIVPATLEQYRICLNLAIKWAAADEELRNSTLTTDTFFRLSTIERWIYWLRTTPARDPSLPSEATKTRSKRTVRGKLFMVHTLWRFAFDRGFCSEEPSSRKDLPQIKVKKENPVAWSIEEMDKILAAARKAPALLWWTAEHWETVLVTFFITTERFAGLMACEESDLQGEFLIVRACNTKDGGSGTHRLPGWLIDRIRRLPRAQGEWVPPQVRNLIWQWPYELETMRRRYKRDILRPAGLAATRDRLFHCLRKTGITALADELGVDAAQRLARHSTPNLTIASYIDATKMRVTTGSDVLAKRLRPNG